MIAKLPRLKRDFVAPYHKYTGPYNPLHEQLDEYDQPLAGKEPYNAVDVISMRHDIFYRDNEPNEGNHACDDEMLQELDVFEPKGIREKIDSKLVRTIIDWRIVWSNDLPDELQNPIQKKFKKRKVFTSGADVIWTADLVDMQSFSRSNKGVKYILMIIDVFSKYGWAIPLQTKTGPEVTNAFRDLWKTQQSPQKLWTERGKEFYNKSMKDLLEKNKVQLYATGNEEKSSIVERWNRTVKRNMWKYFSANNTMNYIDILPNLIKKCNNTYHRSITCTPTRAPSSYQHVYGTLYNRREDNVEVKPKFKVGNPVRILKKKKTFGKVFTPNWTEDLFIVKAVRLTKPITYNIKDPEGETIKGAFYQQERQKENQEVYRIDKVLRRRKRNDGTKVAFVKVERIQ